VPTRWSSDQQMAERALKHRQALINLFNTLEEQWKSDGLIKSRKPEILRYKLADQEWRIIEALQQILKPFTIASRQLQGNPAKRHNRATKGRFDEHYPVTEVLLNHLKRAVNGEVLEPVWETGQLKYVAIPLFDGIPVPNDATCLLSIANRFYRNELPDLSNFEDLSETGLGETRCILPANDTPCYAGVIIMNPFRKIQGLEALCSQIPQRQDPGYLPTVKSELMALWTTTYKNPDTEVPIADPASETFDYGDFTTMRLRFPGRQQSRNTTPPPSPPPA
jgi:hypothetical protein